MRTGYFHYNFASGLEFQNEKRQHRDFVNLKKLIVQHINTNVHVRNKSNLTVDSEKNKNLMKRNYTVGMNLAMSAYKATVKHSSQLEF